MRTREAESAAAALPSRRSRTGRSPGPRLAPPAAALTLLLALAAPCLARAQDPRIDRAVFDTGGQNTGAILQDRDGFIWIGTTGGGLLRYDGYELAAFKPGGQRPFPSAYVQAIFEDGEGIIWVGTYGGGLVRYDKRDASFKAFKNDPADPTTIVSDSMQILCPKAIAEDREGRIWVGAIGGLSRLDKASGKFTSFRRDPSRAGGLSSENVRILLVDRSGALWVGGSGGLDRFDPATGAFVSYRGAPGGPGGATVTAILEDAGRLWIGTMGAGIFELDRRAGTFVRHTHDPRRPDSLANDNVASLTEWKPGLIAVSYTNVVDAGLSLLDASTGTFRTLKSAQGGASSDTINNTYLDRSGILWIVGNTALVDKIDPRSPRFTLYRRDPADPEGPRSLAGENAISIYADRRGGIWIGSATNFAKYDKPTGRFTNYVKNRYFPAIFEDSGGSLWLGSVLPSSLYLFDRDAGRIVRSYLNDPSDPRSIPPNTQLTGIVEDLGGPQVLWISTWDQGFLRFDRRSGEFRRFMHDPAEPNSLASDNLFSLRRDGEGRLWFPTIGAGLDIYDPRTGRFEHRRHDPADPSSPASDSMNIVFFDSRGAAWIGHALGFDRMEIATGACERFSAANGFPLANVASIAEDRSGRLWMGSVSGDGLGVFDPASRNLRIFTERDGLQGNVFYPFNGVVDRDGELWFGGPKGMNSWYPDAAPENGYVPPVVITALRQGGDDLSLPCEPERAAGITLDWRRSFFEFEFAALSFTRPEKNKYRYILEGFDKLWFESGAKRFGRYSNLPGGTYALRVQGSNNDGVWNEVGATLRVRVGAPFWRTAWFYGGLALLAASAAALGSAYIVRLNREVAERKRAVERADAALEQKEALVGEIYHRTKNGMQLVSSLLALYEDRAPSGFVKDSFSEMQDRIASIGLAHQELYLGKNLSSVDLRDYVSDLADTLLAEKGALGGRVALSKRLEDISVTIDVAVPCGLIANELITNALKHAFPGARRGEIVLRLARLPDGRIELSVSDDGAGFDPALVGEDRLGLRITRLLAEGQLHGEMTLAAGSPGSSCAVRFASDRFAPRV